MVLGVACALLVACGDDGTEGLSSCPDYKVALNKNNELVCAPPEKKTGAAGGAAKASLSTASNPQANTAAKPAGSSSAAGAANSGSAGNARP